MNKRIITIIYATTVFLSVFGQENVIETESCISDETISKDITLPLVRNVYGGTKILVTYRGNWTYEMIGAFEYACRIWEEALPTTFPIRIEAVLDDKTTSNQLSKISYNVRSHTEDTLGYPPLTNVSTWTQIKGCAFAEMAEIYDTRTYNSILSQPMFEKPDFKITYFNKGNKLKNNCSFSLSDNIDANMYDFVSIVLRDIGKAWGIEWNDKNIRNDQFRINIDNIIPYEKYILQALDYNGDAHQAYLNALNGNITIAESNGSEPHWEIYSPSTWDRNRSLNYFVPNSSQKISQILSYDFGRGTLVRDIASQDTYNFFRKILRWKGDIAVGISGGTNEESTSTSECLPYNGTINLSDLVSQNTKEEGPAPINKDEGTSEYNTDFPDSLLKYHPNLHSDGNINHQGWSISILKKDGSWDIVYDINSQIPKINISTNNLDFHFKTEDYARSCDGYLRCRISKATLGRFGLSKMSYYYMMDYLPPKVMMKKSMIMPSENENDYYRDVKIGINNIEGVSKIIVSQLDEGEELPYTYEITDFKKGYFIANVDKECKSEFTITAYNKNGITKSDVYTLRPLTLVKPDWGVEIDKNDLIIFDKNNIENNLSDALSNIRITKVHSSRMQNKNIVIDKLTTNNRIDISSFSNGIYQISFKDKFGTIFSCKFTINK